MNSNASAKLRAVQSSRKSGIDCLEPLPWGSHLCQLYRDRDDLLEILVPYFREGLLANEFCMWITSESLPKADAIAALRAEVPRLDDFLASGQIEIFDYREWYLADGRFDGDRVRRGWAHKLDAALKRGYDGLRLSGDTFWLPEEEWEPFAHYESRLDPIITEQRVLAICTYALDGLGAKRMLDAVANHEYALIRENGRWTTFKSLARRKTEQVLKESETRLRATIDGASDSIVTFDETGAIVLANAAALDMFGYASFDMIGEVIEALLPDLWSAAETEGAGDYARLVGSGRSVDGHRKDGSSFPIEWTIRSAAAGKQRLFVAFIRDLTRQREAEARIEKLHADRVSAIGEMATALAHELNQPLAATATYLQTARRLLKIPADTRPASLETALASAAEQTLRAAKILKHIREFIVRDEPNKTFCSLHQLIDDACVLTKGIAKQADVDVALDLRAVDDSVIVDRVQIVQVLVNLSRNAMEAMRGSPERRLNIRTSCADGKISVEVTDTGRGFPEGLGSRIFEPFITPKANSMGVGLSISRSIIEEHYGEISIGARPRGGAQATFSLPLARSAVSAAE